MSKETPRKRDLKAPSAEPEGPAAAAAAERGGAGWCWTRLRGAAAAEGGGAGPAAAREAAAASVAAAAAAAAGVGGVMPPPLASWALVVIFFFQGEKEKERPRSRRRESRRKKVAVEKPVVVRGGMEERDFWLGWGRQFGYAGTFFDRLFPSRAASEPLAISGLGSTRIGGVQGVHQQVSICDLFFLSSPAAEKMPAGLCS